VIHDPVQVLAVAVLVVSLTVWLERFRNFRKIGAAAASILIMMVLSNLRILPGQSEIYDFFTGYGVMAGTALILMGIDLRSVRAAGKTMLTAFGIGAAGSMIGATTMGLLLRARLGSDAWKLSGQFAATYVGGGMNFAAVGQAFGTRSELFSAGVAADVIITAFWLLACLAAPLVLPASGRAARSSTPRPPATPGPATSRTSSTDRFTGPRAGGGPTAHDRRADTGAVDAGDDSLQARLTSSGKPIRLFDAAMLVALTVASIAVSRLLAGWIPAIPTVIWLTSIALLIAQIPTVQALSGSSVLGNYLVLIFLACNGARSVISRIVEVGPEVFYFASGTVLIHGIIIFAIGTLVGIDGGTLAIASQANVGGSASAMAVATARREPDRVLPGIIAGLIGTAIGNYIGFAIGYLVRAGV
jgi:uncharacterized membrane protein